MKKITPFNDLLKFLPLLFIYILICIFKQKDILVGDEDEYLMYADNLLNGFYSDPSHEYSFLWNGPGYPIFLTIFRFLNVSLLIPKLFNAIFLYIGVVYFFKTLNQLISERRAFVITLILGLYYPLLLQAIPRLLTEALSFLLVSLFSYFILIYLKKGSKRFKWTASIILGYLILTKVFFGYVILACILFIFPFLFFQRSVKNAKRFMIVLFLGFCFTIPYLVFTYSQTNKFLYYGNAGGMSLYWMSSPYQNEFGDWHSFETLNEKPDIYINHSTFVNSIKKLSPVEKDIALKKKAVDNILNNKFKFIKNIQSNIGRLFFNYPYTLSKPSNRVLIYLLPNCILFVSLLLTIFLSIKHVKHLDPIIYLIGVFSIVYMGGISLLSADSRFLYPILPVILIWISYMFNKYVSISIK